MSMTNIYEIRVNNKPAGTLNESHSFAALRSALLNLAIGECDLLACMNMETGVGALAHDAYINLDGKLSYEMVELITVVDGDWT